jgi:hypothetical protein
MVMLYLLVLQPDDDDAKDNDPDDSSASSNDEDDGCDEGDDDKERSSSLVEGHEIEGLAATHEPERLTGKSALSCAAVARAMRFREKKMRHHEPMDEQQQSKALLQALAGAQLVDGILHRAVISADQKTAKQSAFLPGDVTNRPPRPSRQQRRGLLSRSRELREDGLFSRARYERRAALAHFAVHHGSVFGNGLTKARCLAIKPLAERYTRATFNEFVWVPLLLYTASVAVDICTDNGGGFLLCALWASSSTVFGLLDSLRSCDMTGVVKFSTPRWIELLDSNVVYSLFNGLAEVVMNGSSFRLENAYFQSDDERDKMVQMVAVILGSGALLQRLLAYALVQDLIGAIMEECLDGVSSVHDDDTRGAMHRELFLFVAAAEEDDEVRTARDVRRTNVGNVGKSLLDEDAARGPDENMRRLCMSMTIKNCLTCCGLLAGPSMGGSFTCRVYDKLHRDRYNEPAAAELLSLEMNRILINAIDTSQSGLGRISAELIPQPVDGDVNVYLLKLLRQAVLAHVNACMTERISTSQGWVLDSTKHGHTAMIGNFLTIVQAVQNGIRLTELAILDTRPAIETQVDTDSNRQAVRYLLQQELSFLGILGSYAHVRQQRQVRTIVNGSHPVSKRGAELRRKTATLLRSGAATAFAVSKGGSIFDVPGYVESQTKVRNNAKAAWGHLQHLFISNDAEGAGGEESSNHPSRVELPDFDSLDALEGLLLRLSILNESTSCCDILLAPAHVKTEVSLDGTQSETKTSELPHHPAPPTEGSLATRGRKGFVARSGLAEPSFKRVYVVFGPDEVHHFDELSEMAAKSHLDLASINDSDQSAKWGRREAAEIRIDESTHEAYVLLANKNRNKQPDVMIRCVVCPHDATSVVCCFARLSSPSYPFLNSL